MPSLEALAKNVNADQVVPDAEKALSFVLPSNGQPNINKLADLGEDVLEDVQDTLGIG